MPPNLGVQIIRDYVLLPVNSLQCRFEVDRGVIAYVLLKSSHRWPFRESILSCPWRREIAENPLCGKSTSTVGIQTWEEKAVLATLTAHTVVSAEIISEQANSRLAQFC